MDPRHCRPFSDEVKTCGVRLDRPTRRCTLQRSPDRNLTECAVRERGAAGTRHGKSSGGLTAVESEEGPDRGDRCGWWSRSGPWSGWPRLLRDADAMNRKGVIERVKIQTRDGALGPCGAGPGRRLLRLAPSDVAQRARSGTWITEKNIPIHAQGRQTSGAPRVPPARQPIRHCHRRLTHLMLPAGLVGRRHRRPLHTHLTPPLGGPCRC